jgi:hypothetical protein
MSRYGARAFSTSEGYAGRNRETESALPPVSARPPSWFSSETGRRQTRSSNHGLLALFAVYFAARPQMGPQGFVRLQRF